MKILEICEFSAGICGVWTRVKQESVELLKRGHEVYVFSSNSVKGTNETAKSYEEIEGIKIYRFPIKFKIGENALFWDFEKKALGLSPDIIIAHVYRHPHTNQALKVAKILKQKGKNCKIFLVTHAPFVSPEIRGFKLTLLTKIYDLFYSKNLNKFDRIIAITKWEIPHLLDLGVKKEKIVYIPNGLPEQFFKQIKSEPTKDVLFLGRIAPIKDLETLIKAAKMLPEVNFSIVGFAEKKYLEKLEMLIGNSKNIKIYPPIYDLKKKIHIFDEHKIVVLPSKRECFGQVLVEAMAREKIVISSKTDGGKEIIGNEYTGFLFDIGNEKELAEKISFCLDKKNARIVEKIKENAKEKAKEFQWSSLINELEMLF